MVSAGSFLHCKVCAEQDLQPGTWRVGWLVEQAHTPRSQVIDSMPKGAPPSPPSEVVEVRAGGFMAGKPEIPWLAR